MQGIEKWVLVAVVLAGGGFFAKLMYDMTRDVHRMTSHVGEMNASMQGMSSDVNRMAKTMDSLLASMQRMDQTIHRGSEQLQRWNPLEMMSPGRPGTAP